MQSPFRHVKHPNSSQHRKIYICRDHIDCSHTYTVIEGYGTIDDVPSYLCYENGKHPEASPQITPDLILAPPRGIHPMIKAQIDEWITDLNLRPAKILFKLEQSAFLSTHRLPTLQQIRQYKADLTKAYGKDLTSLSSFRDYINHQPKVIITFFNTFFYY